MGALFSFSGRVGRSAYWMVTVAGIVLYLILVAWLTSLDPWEMPQVYSNYYTEGTEIYWGPASTKVIAALFAGVWLVLIIIGLSVSVRRWHDHGKSGWWVLIALLPIVGGIYSFVMQGCMSGEPGSNQYGPPPGPRSRAARHTSASSIRVIRCRRCRWRPSCHSAVLSLPSRS